MAGLELKLLTPDLLPAIVALDQLCLGGLWTLDGYQRELDSPNSDLVVLVAQEHDPAKAAQYPPILAYGCLWAIVEEAHITILAVHPEYRRQGLGRLVLVELLAQARRRQLERATLEVGVSNQGAIGLYQQFGFQEAGRRKGYYPLTGEDALILWRKGLHWPEFEQTLKTWQREAEVRVQAVGWESKCSDSPP